MRTSTYCGNFLLRLFLLIFLSVPVLSSAQTTYTFETCGAQGRFGPTQAQVNTTYTATTLDGQVTVTVQGIQEWTVPQTGVYNIEAFGAQGGDVGGLGAQISGEFNLAVGDVIEIAVGQQGQTMDNLHGSGGGGSFVVNQATMTPLLIAGGGGGHGKGNPGINPQSNGSAGSAGQTPPSGGPGGTGGGGGAAASGTTGGTMTTPGGNAGGSVWASGGGGFFTNGGNYSSGSLDGGFAYLNGAIGGEPSINNSMAPGGFGGGGGAGDRGAGGGGYSGGGGGTNNNDGGGGGGSFNSGANQLNVSGVRNGNGAVIITVIGVVNSSPTAVCQDYTAILDASGNVTISGTDVDGGSTDPDGDMLTYSVSPNTFDCADVGTPQTVTLTVDDGNGGSDSCTATVTVVDTTNPVITCPTDITVDNDPGQCDAVVTYMTPMGTDNCNTPPSTLAGFTFLGINQGKGFYLSDASFTGPNAYADAIAQGGFVATVVDAAQNEFIRAQVNAIAPGSAPIIGFNDVAVENTFEWQDGSPVTYTNWNIGEPNNAGNEDYTQISATSGVWNDIIASASLQYVLQLSGEPTTQQTAGLPSGSTFPVGTTTNTFVVTDSSGNTNTCSFTVTVEDNEAPVITCVPDATRDTDPGVCEYTVQGTEFDATFTDNCTSATLSNDLNGTATIAGEILPLGDTTVVWTVDDGNGQTDTCTIVITVEDNEAPVITCVPNSIRDTDPGVCEYTVQGTEFDATFTDNCTSATLSNDLNGTATIAGEVLPLGDTTVIWTVDDGNGQTDTCTIVITVEDNEAPVITCVPDPTVDTDPGVCEYTVQGTEFDATFTDNCTSATLSNDLNGTATIAGEVLPLGDTTVIWTVDDGNGQTDTCTIVITVEDNEAPTITCPADISTGTDLGICGAQVFFVDPLPTDDNCGVASITQTAGLPSGSIFPVGMTTNTFEVTDVNGNTASCSFIVTVTDDEPPMAVCQDITVQLDATGTVSIVAADVDGGSTDNCGVDNISIDIDTFSCADVGPNNVILTVTDAQGLSSTCTAIVTVEDVTDPVIACMDITVQLDAAGMATITPADVATFSDACGIADATLDIDTFSCDDLGNNTVTVTVTDNNGNESSCTATVTVEDNLEPIISCMDFTLELGPDGTAILIPDDVATFSDNCEILATAVDIVNFTCDDIGTPVEVTVFATDPSFNTSACTAIVTVIDALAPVVTCPADITVDPGANNQLYEVPDYWANGDGTAVDNCTDPVTIFGQDPAPGTLLGDGTYTVTLTATDEYGNEGECTFELTVESILGTNANSFDVSSLTLFPNPATDYVVLANPQSIPLQEVNIYDVTGRLVKTIDASTATTEVTIDISELASANYLILINTENGQVTKRLIKE